MCEEVKEHSYELEVEGLVKNEQWRDVPRFNLLMMLKIEPKFSLLLIPRIETIFKDLWLGFTNLGFKRSVLFNLFFV